MAESGAHFYLQLHDGVEDDPRIASLPATLRDLFTKMRRMSLKGETPGEINLAWPALLRCLGAKSAKRQARITELLIEEKRLVTLCQEADGREVVVIARWTMPQLRMRAQTGAEEASASSAPPRKRYPSDMPDRRRAGRDGAQGGSGESEHLRHGSTTPSTEHAPQSAGAAMAQAFLDGPENPDGQAAESCAESASPPHSTVPQNIYSREEKSNNKTAPGATPHASLTPEQNVVVALLISEGIHPPVADRLARRGATPTLVEREIGAMDGRHVRDNRAGLLRVAIEAALCGSPYKRPSRGRPGPARARVTHGPHEPVRPAQGTAPPAAMFQAAKRGKDFKWDDAPDANLGEIE